MSLKIKQELDLVEHQAILSALDLIQIYGKDARRIATLQDKLEKGLNTIKAKIEEERAQIQNIQEQLK